jgi:L-aspartate semialdehyde sulfurtransferase ferredoxin
MFSSRSLYSDGRTRLTSAASKVNQTHLTQVRVHLQIPSHYRQEPVVSRLISEYGLVVNITAAYLGETTAGHGHFDLELRGTAHQISQGLTFLSSLNLKIVGKPSTCGDDWYC